MMYVTNDDYTAQLDALTRAHARHDRWRRWGYWLLGGVIGVPAVLGWLTVLPQTTPETPAPTQAQAQVSAVSPSVPRSAAPAAPTPINTEVSMQMALPTR